ncbi:2-dehydro-3-deoxy-D-gluconate 5-dehydrogenase [Sphingobacterium daejeonense]|uniref:SDR family NAD(P)-dependent oxidoreductase n=1 Tax=Sphingobacterium daejeonense TaxID=371142 RepID=UPI0010C342DC|nr:2-dehydro-3-deoxy-D-gluconate 5-dehydrogenase [Sphingobacterium daejeonense]
MSILSSFNLTGKLALVTGCKRGIGKAMAEGLAEAGADIIGVSANLELEGSEIEKSVKALGRNFYAYQCDFSKRQDLYSFIEKLKGSHPTIDILFNNAGNILRKPAIEHPDEYWDQIIEINQNAQFILTERNRKRYGCSWIWQGYIHCFTLIISGWRQCAGIRRL